MLIEVIVFLKVVLEDDDKKYIFQSWSFYFI